MVCVCDTGHSLCAARAERHGKILLKALLSSPPFIDVGEIPKNGSQRQRRGDRGGRARADSLLNCLLESRFGLFLLSSLPAGIFSPLPSLGLGHVPGVGREYQQTARACIGYRLNVEKKDVTFTEITKNPAVVQVFHRKANKTVWLILLIFPNSTE